MNRKKLALGILLFVGVVVAGVLLSGPMQENLRRNRLIRDAARIYGAVGGGKENFLADPEVNRILLEDYQLIVQNDPWSNGKLIKDPLVYTDSRGAEAPYDFAFFSDQRYYEYYQLPALPGEAKRLPKKKAMIALNTPIVLYSWDRVVDALQKDGIVTEKGGTYYVTDTPRLLSYIVEGKKWSDLGLPEIYGGVNIASTDPVTSSPGATYYGLLAAVMNGGDVKAASLPAVLPGLQTFYLKSGFMNNTPADLFDLYLRTGMGAKPIIVDYEKSIIDFAAQNPDGYAQVKDRARILYPEPTIWNSHCIIAFSDAGARLIDALNDPRIQDIAFSKYGFRTGVAGGQYDVSAVGVSGIPKDIVSVVSVLKMDAYNAIIAGLKQAQQ